MGVYDKLKEVQAGLKAPKSQHNDFGNFNYRSCEDILEAVKPLLKEAGAVLTVTDEIVNIGSRYYVKATARFQDTEDTGSEISVCAYAREPESRPKMDEAQVTGSSSSYARKYALNGLFCIDDAKDPDTTNTGAVAPAQKPAEPKRLQKQCVEKLKREADKKGVAYTSITSRYGKRSLEELTQEDYRRALNVLARMHDRAPEPEPDYQQYAFDMENMPFR